MTAAYWIVIACGVLALIYGVYAYRQVMAAPAGNARMQEIAAAIQEGAQAYLNRQYTHDRHRRRGGRGHPALPRHPCLASAS